MPKSKNTKLSVTIGIPAYNEEANIIQLLKSLVNQKETHFVLDKIIVASDASDDQTVSLVQSFADKRVEVINGRSRKGQGQRQTQIFKQANSDVVVLVNADVLPKNNMFISHLVKPFLTKPNLGLVGGLVVPVESESQFGKMLDWHMSWKNRMFLDYNNADNLYLCHGRARAFSKKVYKQIKWPKVWAEDAYSYLENKRLGFDFTVAKRATILYQSPENFSDHVRQSVRFLENTTALEKHFESSFLKKELAFPIDKILKHFLKGLTEKPHFLVWHTFTLLYCRLAQIIPALTTIHIKHNWEPSVSTKVIRVK